MSYSVAMENIKIWAGEVPGYRLLDSGEKEKLEEINGTKIIRKEPRAWWKKSLSKDEWKGVQKELESILDIGIGGIKAKIKYKDSGKHIGIFPEQKEQWKWIKDELERRKAQVESKEIKVLNLFGYTGIASLVAAQAGLSREVPQGGTKWGAKVTHVDASKQSVDWAKENQKLSGLENAPIRWIVDDVVKFLKREEKRMKNLPAEERGYDAIIMDPPSYGKGPKGEVWKIEDELPKLISICREVLSDEPLFIIFNMYSTELSSISVANLLSDMTEGLGGSVRAGELAIKQEGSGKVMPMSIFAIWEK